MRSEKINWIGDSSLLAHCQGLPLQLLRTGWRRRMERGGGWQRRWWGGHVVLNYGISFRMHCIYSVPFLFVAPIIHRNSCAWNVICDRGDLRVFFHTVFHSRGALTVPLPYGKHKRLSQLLLAALLVQKYHLETEYSIPPAPITPTPVAVIKLKSMILERWWEINMQTRASICSQAQREMLGGCVSGWGSWGCFNTGSRGNQRIYIVFIGIYIWVSLSHFWLYWWN